MEADKKITTSESKEVAPEPAKAQQKSSGPGWMALGFVLAIALAGTLAAAYLWQFSGQQQQSLHASVEAAIQRVDSEVVQTRALQRQID